MGRWVVLVVLLIKFIRCFSIIRRFMTAHPHTCTTICTTYTPGETTPGKLPLLLVTKITLIIPTPLQVFGLGGVGIIVQSLTDNTNRANMTIKVSI